MVTQCALSTLQWIKKSVFLETFITRDSMPLYNIVWTRLILFHRHGNWSRQHWHLFGQTPRHNQEWGSVSGIGISVCHLDFHFPSCFQSQPALSSPARHSQAKHSHLQSPCSVPCPETGRSPVGSEGIKSSFSEQPSVSLIPWAVCKGPSQSPHIVPGWCRSPPGWIPSSTSRAWSCRWKGSLWELSPSHPGSNLSVKLQVYILVTCGWIYKFPQKHKSADNKVPLVHI